MSALRSLAQRRLTEAQLWSRLERKSFEDDEIADAVARCKCDGYLDDKLYAELYVTGARKAVGDARMIAALAAKGVDRDVASRFGPTRTARRTRALQRSARYTAAAPSGDQLSFGGALARTPRISGLIDLRDTSRTNRVRRRVMPGTPIHMGAIRILIAEDDDAIRALLDHHLSSEGFRCAHASDGISALGTARDGVDLAILDIGLPRLDGLEVARMLRREGRRVPILMLTGRSDEVDRIVGFEIGADDYVTKPFLPREIVARVRAILRRTGIAFEDCPRTLRFGRLVIDEGAREARVDGADVGLKPREFALLLELASNAGVALSRSMLLERVWGFDYDGDERTVDVHVRRLRAKIEEQHRIEAPIATVHGFGYKFARA